MFFSIFRKDLKTGYKRINNIPSQIFKSRYGDVEYFIEGDGPNGINFSWSNRGN